VFSARRNFGKIIFKIKKRSLISLIATFFILKPMDYENKIKLHGLFSKANNLSEQTWKVR